MRTYPYEMGFAVNGTHIPDPSVFTGAVSDLDTEGGRDATGYLHRHFVATKHPLKLEYHNIEWTMLMTICGLLNSPQFQFSYPDPVTGLISTVTAYVGDRNWESVINTPGREPIGNLSFSVIEY